MPLQGRSRATAHGRDEVHRIKTCSVARGLGFPHAVQVVRRRRTVTTGKVTLERVYGATGSYLTRPPRGSRLMGARPLGHRKQDPPRARHHLHRGSRVRPGTEPRTMASLRDLALVALRHFGHDNIAAGLRHHARRPPPPTRHLWHHVIEPARSNDAALVHRAGVSSQRCNSG
ncbi:hypothetical protein GCM10010502_74160 [Kitasatospora aureofaciens]|uniref:Uncharacterized protein n=1 Tax=Kitasatospora aureofaciens TaxID=1894 RepID=A0A8H9I5Z9_KITAU|nr:hypothetical protein GCM10010502_74160 [Kitasatospora aureofaciens]